jgi:hypothetical protein
MIINGGQRRRRRLADMSIRQRRNYAATRLQAAFRGSRIRRTAAGVRVRVAARRGRARYQQRLLRSRAAALTRVLPRELRNRVLGYL